ncbi:MAG: hypothetical protein HYV09_40730 [Deltaproteobacteria bacterium]|nr:hypothetical protein [Deltaproteobacteria bacterium]
MLLDIARQRVQPERATNNRENYRKLWWLFGEYRPGLTAALRQVGSCLVTSGISKHRVFVRVPSTYVFSHNLYVFPLESVTAFAVLQSRVHVSWSDLLSSGLEDRGGYRPTDCFETFPFPQQCGRTVIPELESLGEGLYETRARFMIDTNQGLTKTYNALKDPACDDPRILELRRLHEDMDRAVLAAYGWSDIPVPPYCPTSDAHRAAVQAFEDEVIDRLYVLNAERAREEQRLGTAANTARRADADEETTDDIAETTPRKRRVSHKDKNKDQGKLF